ncbi:TPA: hypothetical protein HA251_01790 [Candidatus Woesearchaeota archaeon]|nr:hypothetical protein [Candidatus Woesearchaeota archaeon]
MRRTRIDIICSILTALEKGSMKPTPLLSKANLPHPLFKKYIAELEAAGLVNKILSAKSTTYELTDEGTQYVREYHRFLKFSAGFRL